MFDTIRTHSANLISLYAKYIDSALAELVCYAVNVIDDKINL